MMVGIFFYLLQKYGVDNISGKKLPHVYAWGNKVGYIKIN